MFFTSNMLPSLKSRHGVQKRGPPTPKTGSKKFANPSVFFFDDLKNIVHKIFFAKHFHWWNIQYLPNGPDLGTHPGVSPLIRIIFWIKGLALLILYSTGLGLSKTVFILKMSFFFLFQNLGSNLDLKWPLIPSHTVHQIKCWIGGQCQFIYAKEQ